MPSSTSINLLKYLLPLYLFLLPWQTVWIVETAILNGSPWTYGAIVFYLTEFLFWGVIVVFAWWYLKTWRREVWARRFSFRWSKDRIFFLALACVAAYAYGSILWAESSALAWQHARWIMQAILLFLVILMAPVSKRLLLQWFVYGALVQAVLAIGQFFMQSTVGIVLLGLVEHPTWMPGTSIVASEEIGRWLRPYAAFSHPNALGGYLGLALLACGALLNEYYTTGYRKHFLLFFGLFLVLIAGVFLSFSRTAWLAGGGVVVYTLWQLRHHPRAWLWQGATVVCIGLLTLIYFPLVSTRLFPVSVSEVRSVSERVSYIEQAKTLWQESPWRGVGAGNYTVALYDTYPEWQGWVYQPVHIVPLLMLSELGIIGMSIIGIAVCLGVLFIIEFRRMTSFVFVGIYLLCVLALGDHYLYSSYVGLMTIAFIIGAMCTLDVGKNHA